MKLDKVLCCMILCSFLALTVLKQLFITDRGTNQQKRFSNVTHVKCMSAKQTIVPGRGTSSINLGIFVYSFDVCQAS